MVDSLFDMYTPEDDHTEDWNLEGLYRDLRNVFLQVPELPTDNLPELKREGLRDEVLRGVRETYKHREHLIGVDRIREIERMVYLGIVDEKWKDHLREMDDLKEGIGLRGYGQKDPLVEYKREGFQMFIDLLDEINRETLKTLYRISIEEAPVRHRGRQPERLTLMHEDAMGMGLSLIHI